MDSWTIFQPWGSHSFLLLKSTGTFSSFSLVLYGAWLSAFVVIVEKLHRRFLFSDSAPSLYVLLSISYLPSLAVITGFIAGFVQLIKLQSFYALFLLFYELIS